MKRKIFSKLLMGALLVASISSFTSCKDYDDDIKKNTDDISALTKQISTLETALNTTKQEAAANYATKTEIAKLATAEALQKSINDLQAKIQGNSTKTIPELANDIDAIDSRLNTLGTTLDNIQTAAQAAIKNIELQQTVLDRLQKEVEGDGSSIAGLKDEVAEIKKAIANIGSLEELAKKMTELDKKIDAQYNVLTVLINKQLKSIVLDPKYYWGGVEAVEAPALIYTKKIYTTTYSVADGRYADAEVWGIENTANKLGKQFKLSNAAGAATAVTVADQIPDFTAITYAAAIAGATAGNYNCVGQFPYVEANYFMNPSTADPTNIKGVTVVSDDKQYLTRAAASAPVVKSYKAENGILNVKVGLTFDKVFGADYVATLLGASPSKYLSDPSKITVMASQVQYNDTTVTSDFAAVAPSVIKNIVLADNAASPKTSNACALDANNLCHLYTTSKSAINEVATHSIPWNSPAIDLNQFVEVHGTHFIETNDGTGSAVNEGEFKLENLKEKYGLELKYTLLEWRSGVNQTEETLPHATLNGSMFQPKGINGAQNRSSIGREPLVRVELIDTNNSNAIVAIGYIKFHITSELAPAVAINVDDATSYLYCTGINKVLTWDVVEGKILDQGNIRAQGIAKTTFEAAYAVDQLATAESAEQTIAVAGAGGLTTQIGEPYIYKDGKWVLISSLPTLSLATPSTGTAGTSLLASTTNPVVKYVWNDADPTHVTNRVEFALTYEQECALLAVPSGNEAQPFKRGNGRTNDPKLADLNDEVDVQIAIKMYDKNEGGYPDVYVVFKEKISKLKLTINKLANHWYAANTATTGGDKEIHINVDEYPNGTSATITNFRFDVLSSVNRNELNVQQAVGTTATNLTGLQGAPKGFIGDLTLSDNAKIAGIVNAGGGAVAAATDWVKPVLTFYTAETTAIGNTAAATYNGHTFAANAKGEIAKGITGNEYLLVADGNELYALLKQADGKYRDAGAQKIAEIELNGAQYADGTPYESRIKLDNAQSYAQDLVNVDSHKNLANELTAHVHVSATLNTCDAPVIITNPDFDAKFLRPIDIVGQNDKKFYCDAAPDKNVINLVDLVKFSDWRDLWTPAFGLTDDDLFKKVGNPATVDYTQPIFNCAAPLSAANCNFYRYYDIQSITVDFPNITTDYDGGTLGTTKLSDKTTILPAGSTSPGMILYQGNGSVRSKKLWGGANTVADGSGTWSGRDLGTLCYENNNATVGVFNIRVPLQVKYAWANLTAGGKPVAITVYADIEVGSTLNNGSRQSR